MKDIATLVQKDIEGRAKIGLKKYGMRLQPKNGRDPLIDAYQEALDLCMYLRQLLAEKYNGAEEVFILAQKKPKILRG